MDQYWIIPSGVILSSCELTLDFLHSAGMSIFGLSIHVFFVNGMWVSIASLTSIYIIIS